MIPHGRPIVYVTREIERAAGIEPGPDYRIVSNHTAYGETLRARFPDFITLIKSADGALLGTGELLDRAETKELVDKIGGSILVFKNTLRVEAVIKAHSWQALNPASALAEKVENKVSQVRWLGPLGDRYLPPHALKIAKNIAWRDTGPFIVQWAHGHTGDGTVLVETADQLKAVQEKFPERMARVTAYVPGESFTVNAVVASDRILVGNISYQITGLAPFTDNAFSTVGNDWGAARSLLNEKEISFIQDMAVDIGAQLARDGWRGLYGIDIIRSQADRKICLIEINARQPASSSFESELQDVARKNGAAGLTTFEAHLMALRNQPIDSDLVEIRDGAQIVQRVTSTVRSIPSAAAEALAKQKFEVIPYENDALNSDLIRIQSKTAIMDAHNRFNSQGEKIVAALRS